MIRIAPVYIFPPVYSNREWVWLHTMTNLFKKEIKNQKPFADKQKKLMEKQNSNNTKTILLSLSALF